MSFAKLTNLKTLTKPLLRHHHHRFLSSIGQSQRRPQPQRCPPPQTPPKTPNPNAPKLPEHVSSLTGKRLDLHNRILLLIRDNDLTEASLLTRHSIYSNCKPTIFTINSVLAAFLRQSRYTEFLTLHKFIIQAGVAPNVVTHNLLISMYCDSRKIGTALEHYKQLVNNAPFSPSPTTFRVLVKGLVGDLRVDRAVEVKDEMLEMGLVADPVVYDYLMLGLVEKGEPERALAAFDELQGKLEFVSDGVVYGNLMKAYFLKGMDKEAMEYYADVVGENSSVKMGAVAYNSVLQALFENGRFDEALKLFDKMKGMHSYPMKLMVNLGSFNVMVDGYCGQGGFKEAIEVFRSMGEMKCNPDASSFNNLIGQLCCGGMVAKAEEIYSEMGDGAKPDESTYNLLIDACFGQNRADDAVGYFRKMVEMDLKPNLNSYNNLVKGLIKAGKIDEANGVFSEMIEKLKLGAADYEVMLKALCEVSKLDEVLKLVKEMLKDETVGLSLDMEEVVRDALRKEGREDDLVRVFEEKEREDREKAEALAKKVAEEKAAAEAAAAARANAISSGTLSFLAGIRTANASTAPAETISLNGVTLNDNQGGSGEAICVNASPDIGMVEEATEANDLVAESKNSLDGL